MIAHSAVSSRLDYANALLHGTSDSNLEFSTSYRLHVTSLPYSYVATRKLHWLPVGMGVSVNLLTG